MVNIVKRKVSIGVQGNPTAHEVAIGHAERSGDAAQLLVGGRIKPQCDIPRHVKVAVDDLLQRGRWDLILRGQNRDRVRRPDARGIHIYIWALAFIIESRRFFCVAFR